MANCVICRNLQPDKFDFGPVPGEPERLHIDIPRRTLGASAQASCETCLIIYDAWKATAIGLSMYMPYVCVICTTVGEPLRISGRNNEGAALTEMGQIYALQG